VQPAGGDVHCGAFHLVSNQQNFVMLALSDYDGKGGQLCSARCRWRHQPITLRCLRWLTTSLAESFDVPSTFSKQARFRTVYTCGWNTDWGAWGGVTEMRLLDDLLKTTKPRCGAY